MVQKSLQIHAAGLAQDCPVQIPELGRMSALNQLDSVCSLLTDATELLPGGMSSTQAAAVRICCTSLMTGSEAGSDSTCMMCQAHACVDVRMRSRCMPHL